MNDSPTSGNRWEHAQPAGNDPQTGVPASAPAGPVAGTAVQEHPEAAPDTGHESGTRKGSLRDRFRQAPDGTKWAAGSAAAVVALAAVGVGGFAIGRVTASHGDTAPGQFGPGGSPGGFPHDDDGYGQDFGAPGGPGSSESGTTGSGASTGSATNSAWYVVPAPTGPEAS